MVARYRTAHCDHCFISISGFGDVPNLIAEHVERAHPDPMKLGVPPQPGYTPEAAIAVCERCGHGWGVERSLWGLVNAETDHALAGCDGPMYLTSNGIDRLDSVSPAPRVWQTGEPPPLPPPDLGLFERVRK